LAIFFCKRLFYCRSNADTVQHGADHQIGIVEGYWALGIDGERLATFFELPTVEAFTETKADAGVIFQVSWCPGNRV